MFKDFDKVSKEGQSAAGQKASSGEDPQLMNLLNTFAKDLLSGEAGSAGGSGEHGLGGMDKLMSEF